jgi:hypothetical protein
VRAGSHFLKLVGLGGRDQHCLGESLRRSFANQQSGFAMLDQLGNGPGVEG